MKRITLFVALSVAFFMTGSAQTVPMGMKYQAVARDLSGNVLANQQVALKITLHSDIELKNIEYSETHFAKTNEVGLFTLVIGEGEVITGDFSKVPWSSKDIWMEVSIRDKGASDFVIISDSRLLAVPYAFHAGTASELIDPSIRATGGGGVPANVWSLFGNSATNDETDRLGTTDCQDLVVITDNLERLRVTCEGSVSIKNDLGVGNDLDVTHDVHIGNDLTVDQDVFLNVDGGSTTVNGDLTVANMKSTHLTGTLEVDKATDLNLTLNVDGTTTLNDDLTVTGMNPTHLTGTLEVDKATDLSLTLNVDGATDLNSTLNVDGNTTLNNDLTVTGMNPTHLTGTLEVDKATDLSSTLNVDGAADLNSTLNVDGTLTVAGVATINNTLNVNGSSSYIANFVNSTNANGISIQVAAATPANANNFVTFKNSGGTTVGRVEGQTLAELHLSFGYIWYQSMEAVNTVLQLAMVVVDIIGLDDIDASVVEGVEWVAAIAEWVKVSVELDAHIGVVYSSGSGDYAEWLEKANSEEVFSPGDIVGIRGGKISKAMDNADQYMVVSLSPIILGNMPPENTKDLFEKVAFMGQVPVKVRGVVNIGDYIITSDMEDGFGQAIAPLEITLDQYKKIVGVAWSESDGKKAFSMINVAVGINNNDTVDKLKIQQEKMEAMMLSMNSIISYLQTKDPSFNADLFAVSPQNLNQNKVAGLDLKGAVAFGDYENNLAKVANFLEQNPDVMQNVLADAKEILDSKGVDYNRFEQTNRLMNDQQYFISLLRESSK